MGSKISKEFNMNWPDENLLKFSDEQRNILEKSKNVKKPNETVTIEEIIANSKNFPIEFPINSCRVGFQPKERYDIIQQEINSVYPIIHERVVWLYIRFLEHKTKYGNEIEKEVYSNMNLIDFIDRLLTKRCATFCGEYDRYLLVSKQFGLDGHTTVGTLEEKPPLVLKNCLSYDEIKLSAFLSVSSHTEFINDGDRKNMGPRMVRRGYMEYQDIIISEKQNNLKNGYGFQHDKMIATSKSDYRKMWNDFYGERKDFIYIEVKSYDKRFLKLERNEFFDKIIMKKRFTISFDTLLLEAETRASISEKQAYIHVVGIGLGVWRYCNDQINIFLATFSQRLKRLLPKLNHISVINLSYFPEEGFENLKNDSTFISETHPNGGIRIYISKRNPHKKLDGKWKNCLPIVSYAWDGNSLPGNEFWMKQIASSSDSAAASSTLITELHNAHINKRLTGKNLHVAMENFGVVHISEYITKSLTENA
ncbi:uncharacterized protein LOC129606899 isoform X2 [Condylostylus longicornis]|uniref:uncharacterized protein LOC129606899 isoform X2 n=1 Tax=Condylostylus longicornis TaxID=2530218 RepID=UPI00244DEA85|nr:uncharacterized protein LOC129606899 isoform X2 [Condylostylus longicornis]